MYIDKTICMRSRSSNVVESGLSVTLSQVIRVANASVEITARQSAARLHVN
jgi:hypothetical protein